MIDNSKISLDIQKVRESIANKIDKVEALFQETLKDIQPKKLKIKKIRIT